jgi:hypothetical protein
VVEMLLTKEVEVNLSSKVITHYENKGYFIPKYKDESGAIRVKTGTKIIVKVDDLPRTSLVEVEVKCDYCGKHHPKAYGKYLSSRMIIEKDACQDCCKLKQQEVFNLKYGVNSPMQVEEMKNKIIEKTRRFSDIQELQREFKNKNCLLITPQYFRGSQQLEFICLKHDFVGIQTCTYNNFCKDKYCRLCGNEKIGNALRHSLEYIIKRFDDIDCDVLINEYKNGHTLIPYKCRKHPKYIQFVTYSNMHSNNVGCKFCRMDKRIKNSNYNIPKSDLFNFLRGKIKEWKLYSAKMCNYQCVLTHQKFNNIHHLFPFHKIIYKVLDKLSLPLFENIEQYTNEQLSNIIDECLNIHFELGYGICLVEDLHTLFHQIYGYSNTNKDDFDDFSSRYKNFEFDDLIENEQYKYKNVLKAVS